MASFGTQCYHAVFVILLNYVLLEVFAVHTKQSIISQVDCTFTRKKAGNIIIAK